MEGTGVIRDELRFDRILLGFRAATNRHALEERSWRRRAGGVLRGVFWAPACHWLKKRTARFGMVGCAGRRGDR